MSLPKIFLEANLIKNLPDIIGDRISLIICDENTYKLCSDIFKQSQFNNITTHILQKYVLPLDSLINDLLLQIKEIDFEIIISLGSGTITDICKRVSYLSGIDCILFPTAASVNAYTSGTASIMFNGGQKISVKASLPKEIYVDLDIIYNAPKSLTASGFADLLCRASVEPDCLLSHLLLGTYYNADFFNEIKNYEEELLNNHQKLIDDQSLIKILMEGLLLSGEGMYNSRSSIVASQGEHQIAHIIDLKLYKMSLNRLLHGETIALTSIYMMKLQNKIINIINFDTYYNRDISNNFKYDNLDILSPQMNLEKFITSSGSCTEVTERNIESFYGESSSAQYYSIYLKKKEICNSISAIKWKKVREKLLDKRPDYEKYLKAFAWLHLPTKYQDLEIDLLTYNQICKTAFYTRERLTFLDLEYFIFNY